MDFQRIDVEQWKRREYYEHYFSEVPCTYSMTVNLDISSMRARRQKLYPTMLYHITAAVNRHEEFRTALDNEGKVGVFGSMNPCYTVFHPQSELFSNIWTEFDDDYGNFCNRYENDLRLYGGIERMEAKPDTPENTFPVSMLPWAVFTGFQLNLQKGYNYFLPIFTMGKFFSSGGRQLLPLSVQVHHAVCDGFHLSRLLNELQEQMDA